MAQPLCPSNNQVFKPGITLDEYLELINQVPNLDTKEPEEYDLCYICHQIALEVFASFKNKKEQRVFCSSNCFKVYKKMRKEKERIAQIREAEERKDIVKKESSPINIRLFEKSKQKRQAHTL